MAEFNSMLRHLRRTYVGKQLSLAGSLGYTEAAISLWENGERLPLRRAQVKIMECLREAGVPSVELQALQAAYDSSFVVRAQRHVARWELHN